MGLAVGSLRNAWASAAPGTVRRKGWGALGFSLILIVLYMFAIVIAANRIAGGG